MTTDASKRGKRARTRGAEFEREICRKWFDEFGQRVYRRTDGPRGHCEDVSAPPFSIECKWYERISVRKWLDQACVNAPVGTLPVVVMRENGRSDPMALMPWWVFAQLARGELIATDGGRIPQEAALDNGEDRGKRASEALGGTDGRNVAIDLDCERTALSRDVRR